MSAFKIVSAIAFVSFALGIATGAGVEYVLMTEKYEAQIDNMRTNIDALHKKYSTLADIINCESGGRHEIYGDNGRAYGIAQFHEETFEEMAAQAGCEGCRYTERIDQLRLLSWAYDNGKINKWSCYDSQ